MDETRIRHVALVDCSRGCGVHEDEYHEIHSHGQQRRDSVAQAQQAVALRGCPRAGRADALATVRREGARGLAAIGDALFWAYVIVVVSYLCHGMWQGLEWLIGAVMLGVLG